MRYPYHLPGCGSVYLKRRLGCCFLSFCILILGEAGCRHSSFYLQYDSSLEKRTPRDHRFVRQRLWVTDVGEKTELGFHLWEDVLGCLENRVETRQESLTCKIDPVLVEQLAKNLRYAGILDMSKNETDATNAFSADLIFRMDGIGVTQRFTTIPTVGVESRVYDVLNRFMESMEEKNATSVEKTLYVAEGDAVIAEEVSFNALVDSPSRYHGRRISVSGYCESAPEWLMLFPVGPRDRVDRIADTRLELVSVSSFAVQSNIVTALETNAWVKVTGVFLFLNVPIGSKPRPFGLLDRVTRVDNLEDGLPRLPEDSGQSLYYSIETNGLRK